jgi:FKBP-type peptidyl-prolyl cis-trans isomerase FkpA
MLKKTLAIIVACSSAFIFPSCNEYKKNENGLRYKIIKDSAGKPGELGGFMLLNYEIRNSKDSLFQSTYKSGGPMPMEIQKATFKGGLEEGFTLLSQGDSAVFLVSSDSIFAKNQEGRPKGIEKGSDLKFIVKVVKMFSKEEVKKEQEKVQKDRQEQQQEAFKQLEKDTITIVNHLKSKNLNALRTENGVYYVIQTPGKGDKLKNGDSVQVNYTGKFLDGKEFESGPYSLVIGESPVIYGWTEGLMQLKDGDKATLFIPSPLGYGKQGSGSIPANTILVFDIEVSKSKK